MGLAEKYCVIGAGACGIAAAKNFQQRGIPYDIVEAQADLGGTWNIATDAGLVYETTHLISTKRFTVFDDFPMDESVTAYYPHHSVMLAYLRRYAEHFGVTPRIEFNKKVESLTTVNVNDWRVKLAGEPEARRYRGVVVASGHHSVPRLPTVPGTFAGKIMHSSGYKHPDQLRNKRIVVVGAGNSACDIVVDGTHAGGTVTMSMRRGYWFVPKFTLGWPTHGAMEYIEMAPLPRWLKTRFYELSHTILAGHADRYGLPRPDYHIDEAHPTMGDDVVRLAAHGRIGIKPAIERYDGDAVIFTDGSRVAADLVVFATGYEVSFPFMDKSLVLTEQGHSRLYMNAFHPERDDLFVIGLVQANGSAWRIGDLQSRVMADYIVAMQADPVRAQAFRQLKAGSQAAAARTEKFVGSPRHAFEANYFDYTKALKRLNRKVAVPGRVLMTPGGQLASPAVTPVQVRAASTEEDRAAA
jgi:Flavin-binding monooxygenase-like